jgi:hypothetical protein
MYMLMRLVLSVTMASYEATRIFCLHAVSLIEIGIEGAHQEEEQPSHHHVVQETSLPHEPSHKIAEQRYHPVSIGGSIRQKTTVPNKHNVHKDGS